MNRQQSQRKPFVIHHCMSIASSRFNSLERLFEIFGSNTGNSYITYSLIKGLYGWNCDFKGIQNIWMYDYSKQDEDIDYINTEASEVFLNLTDFIRVKGQEFPDIDIPLLNSFLKRIKKPLHIIGIGANAFGDADKGFVEKLSPEMKEILHTLSYGANVIGVRGTFTEEMLYQMGIKNVAAIGCPTFYENGAFQYVRKDAGILEEKDIVLTSYYDMQKYKAKHAVILQGCPEEQQIREYFAQRGGELYKIFSSIPEWKEFLKNYKFAVGMRVHGGIIALNSGVPALILNKDRRAREMIDLLKLPQVPLTDNLDFFSLYQNADYDAYNQNYHKIFASYLDFLKKDGLEYEGGNLSCLSQPAGQNPEMTVLLDKVDRLTAKVDALGAKKKGFFSRFNRLFRLTQTSRHIVVTVCGIKMKFKKRKAGR